MKAAIVASSFLPERGRLERRVDQLARGLVRYGAEVEILTQGPQAEPPVDERDGVIIRRYSSAVGPLRLTVAPDLWERLRTQPDAYDLVDVHTRHAPLALAVGLSRARRLVFTPGAPLEGFLSGLQARATRSAIISASRIICRSEIEGDLVRQAVPRAADRVHVVPDGVDVAALRSAEPFPTSGTVVLAVDRLGRTSGVTRAIAAMASLDPRFRLVVVGDGPVRKQLVAYAADLRISSRVEFVGAVCDEILYRWFQTARVVVALADERGSGLQITEGLAAGAPVVASDVPSHRRAAEGLRPGNVIFVAPKGSPLDVADAITEAARLAVLPSARIVRPSAPSWDEVIASTWTLYQELMGRGIQSPAGPAAGELVGAVISRPADGKVLDRANGAGSWQ